MKKTYFLIILIGLAVICCFGFNHINNSAVSPVEQTAVIVKAAANFLNSLNAEQKAKTLFPFTQQKAAVAAKFARTGNQGGTGGAPPGGGGKQGPPPGGENFPKNGPPGVGGGRGGQFPGFVGEKYGQAVWSNYPVSDVPRPGLKLGSLNATQREAAMHMLQELLSVMGYEKVLEIMGSDQALADGGTNFASGKDTYTMAIFGTQMQQHPGW